MAQQDISQYKYAAMSNLVLQHDRRFTTRRGDEATGDPESLAGQISVRDMGSRVNRPLNASKKESDEDPSKLPIAAIQRGAISEGADILAREQRKRKRGQDRDLLSNQFGFSADSMVEGIRYSPRTATTRSIYGLMLAHLKRSLVDVPQEVVISAADAILEQLKNPELKDVEKKKEVDDVLQDTLSDESFNELLNLSKKLTDYDGSNEESAKDALKGREGSTDRESLDERQGVAVLFEDEDEDDDGELGRGRSGIVDEVRSIGDSTDSEVEADDPDGSREPIPDGNQTGIMDRDDDLDSRSIGDDLTASDIKSGLASPGGSKRQYLIFARDIDAFWIQRQTRKAYKDPHEQQLKAAEAYSLLSECVLTRTSGDQLLRQLENDLMALFDFEHHEIVRVLVANREKIVFMTQLARLVKEDERDALQKDMESRGYGAILNEMRGQTSDAESKESRMGALALEPQLKRGPDTNHGGGEPKPSTLLRGLIPSPRVVNLDDLAFDQGNHLLSSQRVTLPAGSTKRTLKGWEEIHVPAPSKNKPTADDRQNISISELPEWAQDPFKLAGTKELNRIQTRCFEAAFEGSGNLLICAPTGSGKTNVALLAVLHEIGRCRHPTTGELDLNSFKVVYIAPLKALVQEQVGMFKKRLACYGISAAELTGDSQLTKEQITETQIIVTTPEKWDIITRKSNDASYTRLVRLIIIDEIHLLHDDRGPVIESIVSRHIRRMEHYGEIVRLVGLSATLPNYRDVANFLRVDTQHGLFHFDSSFRPVPLRQEFIGVTDKKAIKQIKTMNDVTYIKTIERAGSHQVLIFVHSRKETAKTARYIRDKALELETIGRILRSDAATKEILRDEADHTSDKDLRDLLPYGFAIHHAGMSRNDRTLVENLFDERYIQVLVCTATLAWGVNLPAHTVIIKGTQIYSPEKGRWVELSPQDVLQMLGRAGRPQHDTSGEGIIITTHNEVQFYLSLLNQQLPIESQLISKLVDSLNAEVVLGTIRNRDEGVDWLGYSYLFVRMLRSPGLYRVGAEYELDHALEQKRVDLIHAAALTLNKANLIKYNPVTGKMQSTDLGRIASHYYISHKSIQTYSLHLHQSATIIELFRTFALSEEFKYIPVRQDEKLELAKLLTRVPVPIKENIEEPAAKINVLLQAYISRLKLDGLALMADLIYVTQSAGRILRAIFEIALRRGWSTVSKLALDLCKTTEKRIWPTMSPLRQYPQCDPAIIRKAERVEMPWANYLDFDAPRLGELLGTPQFGRAVHDMVQKFPRLDVSVSMQPLTRSHLHLRLEVTPRFIWDRSLHGQTETFWVFVEDSDGESILCFDQFLLRGEYASSEHNQHLIDMSVTITEPLPPNYFVTIISDRWMHSSTQVAVSLQRLILPDRFPPPSAVLDLQPLTKKSFGDPNAASIFSDIRDFNKMQTQVFNVLGCTGDSCSVSAPSGSGKTICAEFAIIWQTQQRSQPGKLIYMAPHQSTVDVQYADWQRRLQSLFERGSESIGKLTGDLNSDFKLLERSDLVLGTPIRFDALTRQWRRRRIVQSIRLVIADDLHLIGEPDGSIYELVISRLRFMAIQAQIQCRFVALTVSLSDPRDMQEWLGIETHAVFNFTPQSRPLPLTLYLQSYTIPHFPSLMLAMARPAYEAVLAFSPAKAAIIFVSGRKQARLTATDIAACCSADEQDERFLHAELKDLAPILDRVEETALVSSLSLGIAYYHEAMSSGDKRIVEQLFIRGALQVLICSREAARELKAKAYLVIVMGTQYYEGREHRYVDYPLAEVLYMFGRANRPQQDTDSRAVLMTNANKREYYKKFVNEALPVESHLPTNLHDTFISEISCQAIDSTQGAVEWTYQYTFFYRRLISNPSFYGLADISNEGVSTYLSELVETTIKELSDAKLIDFDEQEDSVTPANPAMIASYYAISFATIQTFVLSLNPKTRLKGFLEIVASAAEFEKLGVRRHEDRLLRQVYDRVPMKLAEPDYRSSQLKAFVLLQAHFSRLQLPIDLAKDQEMVLTIALDLVGACIDLLSSEGHQNATRAMEISQMIVQALWTSDSPLKQIPYFGDDQCQAALKAGVEDVQSFMEAMDPASKVQAALLTDLRLDQRQLAQAANFTNDNYPDVEMEYQPIPEGSAIKGMPLSLKISLQRDCDDATDIESMRLVHAPFFPKVKTEGWWLVVTDKASRSLLAIKKVAFAVKLDTKLDVVVPDAGVNTWTLALISDSYIGVDQEQEVVLAAGEEEEESSEAEVDGED